VLPLAVGVLVVWGAWWAWRGDGPGAARRAANFAGLATAAWLATTWQVAASGVLRQWERTPPPFAMLIAAVAVLAVLLPSTPFGGRLARAVPVWVLVAVQGFRLPLELAMHAMAERGVMPAQMSYTGRNFDIITGITALIVAPLVARGIGGRRLVAIWNVLGLGLVLNVVVVAMLSTPTFRVFGDDALNTWVADPPYVWLPAVLVLAAVAGHLVVFRALAARW
jgi:small-conductance mechanosensitive channel